MSDRTLRHAFQRFAPLVLVASTQAIAPANAQDKFTVEREVATALPTAKERRSIAAKLPKESKSLMADKPSIAYMDLDKDGVDELIIFASASEWCGSLGCTLSIHRNVGNRWVEIASLIGDGNIGLVREITTGRYAIAFLDSNGRIAPLHTKAYPAGKLNMTPPINRVTQK